MALLRRGASTITGENFRGRLEREKAKTGAITASLAWNDPSDLDLHCHIILESGGTANIYYGNKQAGGGVLDVDMHANDRQIVEEPVENIFWKNPLAGTYSISVHLYSKRGSQESAVPFKMILKRDGLDDLSMEGAVGDGSSKSVECFRFTVDGDENVTMGAVGSALPPPKTIAALAPAAAPGPMKAMKAVKAMKAMAAAAMKASSVAEVKRIKEKTALAIANAKKKEKSALAKLMAKEKLKKAKAKAATKAKLAQEKLKVKSKAAAAKAKKTAAVAKVNAKAKAVVAAKAKAKSKSNVFTDKKKAKVLVFQGKKTKTRGGLKKEDLVKSKANKIVSRKKSELGKSSRWSKATNKARELKGYTGFKPIKKGTSFYEKAKELMAEM